MKLGVGSLAAAALVIAGCSTSAQFKVPANSKLFLDNEAEPVAISPDGEVTTRPYSWGCSSGIPYRLVKADSTTQIGSLPADFRPASIFWPPYALFYWPMGFREDVVYDLTSATASSGTAAK